MKKAFLVLLSLFSITCISLATALLGRGGGYIPVLAITADNFDTSFAKDGEYSITSNQTITKSYEITANVVLNLGKYTISAGAEWTGDDAMFVVKDGGSLTLTGSSGCQITTGDNQTVLSAIKVIGDNAETPSCLYVNETSISGNVYGISGDENYDNTIIEIDNSYQHKITQTADNGAAIYHPQDGSLTIIEGDVVGSTGIYFAGGTFKISGEIEIIGTGTAQAFAPVQDGIITSTGDGFVVDNSNGDLTADDFIIESIGQLRPMFITKNGSNVASYAYPQENTLYGFLKNGRMGQKLNPYGEMDRVNYSYDIIADGYDAYDDWNGNNESERLYNLPIILKSHGLAGAGSQKAPYQINSLADFLSFAASSRAGNKFYGKYISLNTDLDFSSVSNFAPMEHFNGQFDGHDHKISNLTIHQTETARCGMFVSTGGELAKLENGQLVVKVPMSTIKNLHLSNVNVYGADTAGAFVGSAVGIIENCSVSGTVAVERTVVGAFVGSLQEGALINCVNNATVTGDRGVGGFVGSLHSSAVVQGCTNNGTIMARIIAGGIVGTMSDANVIDCVNNGVVKATGFTGVDGEGWLFGTDYYTFKSSAGGIAGELTEGEIANCTNAGEVSGPGLGVGGIAGMSGGTIEGCSNTGAVSTEGKGAIVRYLENDDSETVHDYEVYTADSIGGVSGFNTGTVTNCINTGTVSGQQDLCVGTADNTENGLVMNQDTVQATGAISTGGVVGTTGFEVLATNNPQVNVSNNLNLGTIEVAGEEVDGNACALDVVQLVEPSWSTTDNNFYLSDTETENGGRTAEQIASGQVAYELNGNSSEGAWGQDLTTDENGNLVNTVPTVGGSQVHMSPDGTFGNLHVVTVSATNGSVTVNGETTTQAVSGSTVTILTTPNQNYELYSINVYADGASVPVQEGSNGEYTFTMPSKEVSVVVKFELVEYEVTLDVSSANETNLSIFISHGHAIDNLVAPAYDGYIFMGWYTDAEFVNVYDLSTAVMQDFTLYAKYEHYTRTVERLDQAQANLQTAIDTKASATDLANAVAELDAAKANIVDLQDMIDDYVQADTDLKEELEQKIADATALINSTLSTLQGEVNTLKDQVATLITGKADVSYVNEKVAELTDKIDALEAVCNAIKTDYALKTEVESAINQAKTDVVNQCIALIESAKQELQDKIDDKANATDLANAVAELDTAKANIVDLQDKIDDYAQADADLKEELEQKIADATAVINATLSTLQGEVNTLKDQVATLIPGKADVSYVNEKVAELTDKIDALEAVCNAIKTDYALKTEVESAIATAKTEVVNQCITLINNAKVELQNAIDQKAESSTVTQKFNEVNQAIALLEGKTGDYTAADTALKQQIDADLTDLKAEILQIILAGDQQTKDELSAEIADLQEQLDQLRKDLEKANTDNKLGAVVPATASIVSILTCIIGGVWFLIERKGRKEM